MRYSCWTKELSGPVSEWILLPKTMLLNLPPPFCSSYLERGLWLFWTSFLHGSTSPTVIRRCVFDVPWTQGQFEIIYLSVCLRWHQIFTPIMPRGRRLPLKLLLPCWRREPAIWTATYNGGGTLTKQQKHCKQSLTDFKFCNLLFCY